MASCGATKAALPTCAAADWRGVGSDDCRVRVDLRTEWPSPELAGAADDGAGREPARARPGRVGHEALHLAHGLALVPVRRPLQHEPARALLRHEDGRLQQAAGLRHALPATEVDGASSFLHASSWIRLGSDEGGECCAIRCAKGSERCLGGLHERNDAVRACDSRVRKFGHTTLSDGPTRICKQPDHK